MRRLLFSTGLAVLTFTNTGCQCFQPCVDGFRRFETWKWNALCGHSPPAQPQAVCEPIAYAPVAVAAPAPICAPISTNACAQSNPCAQSNACCENSAAYGPTNCCEGPAMTSGMPISGMPFTGVPTTVGAPVSSGGNCCGQNSAQGTVITTVPTLAPSTTLAPQTYSTSPIPGPVTQ